MSALMAENLTVSGHAGACESRHEGLTATGSGPLGAVCLAGASVTGQLSLRGTTLVNESGPALLADLITIGDGARLDQDFSAEGEGEAGALRLPEARISGDLLLNGARLSNHTGPALLADGLTVHSDLVLDADVASGRRFEAAGAGRRGTVLIRGATISGRLSLEGAHVRRGHAPGSQPAQQVRDEIEQHSPAGLAAITTILRGCDCEPAGIDGSVGAVCLSNTTVGGRLAMRNAFLCNDTGPALMADYLTVKNDAAGCEEARNGLTAIGSGPSAQSAWPRPPSTASCRSAAPRWPTRPGRPWSRTSPRSRGTRSLIRASSRSAPARPARSASPTPASAVSSAARALRQPGPGAPGRCPG